MVVGEEFGRDADAMLWFGDDGRGAGRHLQVHSPPKVHISDVNHQATRIMSIFLCQIHRDIVPLFNPRCPGTVGHPAQIVLLSATALVPLLRTHCDDPPEPDGKI